MPDPITGLVVGGTTLIGGAIQSSAAGKASKAQQQSAEAGIAEQRRQFDAVQAILSPYVQAGTSAIGALQPFAQAGTAALGRLDPFLDAGAAALGQLQPFIQAGTQALGGLQEFGTAGVGAIGGLQDFSRAGTSAIQGLDPYASAGAPALAQQQALLGLRGPQAQQASISAIERSPAFQAQVRQGEEAILQAASATGGLRGGNVQAALAQFRPQMLQREIDLQYGRLGGLTSLGQGTTRDLASMGLQSTRDLTGLGQSSFQDLSRMGLNTAQNLANFGFTGAQNLANIGQSTIQNIAQLGQSSAAGTGSAGLQTGARIAGLQGDIGAARAGADLARGQALSSVFNLPAQFLGAQLGAGQTPGFGSLFSGGGGGGGQAIYANAPFNNLQDPGGMAQTNIGFSDRRLKTNIHQISTRPDGLGVYEFEYIWGGGKHIGLMAQEVLGIYPDAVGSVGGYYTVDYSRV